MTNDNQDSAALRAELMHEALTECAAGFVGDSEAIIREFHRRQLVAGAALDKARGATS